MLNQKLLEKKINLKFKNKKLLSLALTHKSSDAVSNNEKLEFLGDRVLGLVLSKKLFNLYPNENEGDLDKKFASLVNKKTCSYIAKTLELNKFLILGNSYKNLNIEEKITGDACEALIGAIYIDSGYKIAENFILKYWNKEIKKSTKVQIDPKTKLQEYSLKLFKKLPIYKVLSYKGPQHNPLYKISVKINETKAFHDVGNSKKKAEHAAAEKLLKYLKIN